jgi:uncharacterized surface protein with fasciclin (FAS1) repeats
MPRFCPLLKWIFTLAIAFAVIGETQAADDLITAVQKTGRCKVFVKLIQVAGLTQTIKGYGSLTVFAPIDEGFAMIPKDILDELVKPENKPKLASILLAHVIRGKVMAADLKTGTVTTLGNSKIHLANDQCSLTYGGANIVKPDLVALNGVIHLIDKVVLPEQVELPPEKKEGKTRGQSDRAN